MNKFLSTLGFIGAILGLILSFLPLSNFAIYPAIIGLFLGLIVLFNQKKQGQDFIFPRVIVIVALIGIVISVGKQLMFKNKVVEDTEFNQKTEKSKQDAVKDLEELDEELDSLE